MPSCRGVRPLPTHCRPPQPHLELPQNLMEDLSVRTDYFPTSRAPRNQYTGEAQERRV